MAEPFQPRFVDLVRNYTTTQGTGNFVLGPAVNGYRSFATEIQPGESFYYSVVGIDKPAEFEVGRGTMQADRSISRDPIGTGLTGFTEGNKSIALVAAAEWHEKIHAGTAIAAASAASRSELAAMDTARPAMLTEPGREGLFVFDPSDRSADVSGDSAQGVVVAPASDPTGASGAWVRRYTGPVEAGWFGAAGNGIADDTGALRAAIKFVEAGGGGVLRLGDGTFSVSAMLSVIVPDVTIDARGATVTCAGASAPMVYIGGDRTRILGGTWMQTGGLEGARSFDVEGVDCEIDGARIVKSPEAGGYHAYIRQWAEGFVMRNCRTEGSNGIYCEAGNSAFLSNCFKGRAVGGDDAVAIKGTYESVNGVRIIGNQFENLAYFCSIGSEIGILQTNDPSYSRKVSDVAVIGNCGTACTGIAIIKPGANSIYDYRDGTVENVTISDNVLSDPAGSKFNRGISIMAARGARVRNVRGRGNIIRARSGSTSARTVGAVELTIPNYSGGSVGATISDVDLQVLYDDPHDGQETDATRPGYPVKHIVAADLTDVTIGRMARIRLDVRGNGCSSSGVLVGPGLDDALDFPRISLTNSNRTVQSLGGFYTESRVRVGQASIEPFGGNAYNLGATGEIIGQVSNAFFCEAINAGNDGYRRPWAAPVRCYVTKVELLSSITIPQSTDDINYTQFELRNTSGTSNIFRSVNSAATGGQSFPADTFNVLMLARSVTGTNNQKDCYFAKDGTLMLNKNDFGSGRTVQNAHIRIHWAPY